MWMGSLPLENCIPGNAPWLGSLDATVVGSLSLWGLGRSFPDDALRVSPPIATGADLSVAAGTGATAGVAVSAAATGITGGGDAAGTIREAGALVSGTATTAAAAAAVAAATGGTAAGATVTAEAAGEALPEAPDSNGTGGGLLATGAGDDSTDGIGSELVVGSTRTSDT